ncbi:MAG: hypothetical protein KDN19_08420 [Verrucomicrobiae bacterium]|nr:hypothetical protein [Verrucomicrobiae bacterium]
MKLSSSSLWWSLGIAAASFLLSAGESLAQDENLKQAMADQKRRTAGMTALANQVKSLFDWIPGVDFEEEEEETTPAPNAPEVKVKEARVVASESTVEGEGGESLNTAADEAELEAEIYRRKLQEAGTKLNITGAFPNTKEIMVGAERLGVGETIAIKYQEQFFELAILDITPKLLKLRDKQSQLALNVSISVSAALPAGMFRSPPPDGFQVVPLSKNGAGEVANQATAPKAP